MPPRPNRRLPDSGPDRDDGTMAATTAEPWVGRSIQRVEDDALLRGEGRFLDDLAPVAAQLPRGDRPLAARTRADRGRCRRRRSTLPGVVGVLTGADVAALSRPFPAGIESGTPQYAAAIDTVRYVGEPIAVVVARDRYLAEDAAELVEVDYDPLEPVLDPVSAAAGSAVHDRAFAYGDADAAMAAADLVLRQTFRFPRFTCTPVECYAVVADWDAAAGRLTAWANFQGPFTLHGVAAAALGLKGDRLRLLTPPDSGGSFGIKSAVFSYVVLIGLASRHLGVPVTLDRGPARAPRRERGGHGPDDGGRGGLHVRRPAVALRYDAIEDVGAYVRAPEPATLYRMHGSLSGAYRVPNVAVRNRVVLTNTIPSGLNRGFGGPQLYLGLERTMAIAARRLGLDPAELARRNLITADEMPYRTPSGALYDSGDYAACLDKALELADYDALRARVATRPRRGAAGRDRARLHRRAVDLEHGLHHARPDGRRARAHAAQVGQRRGCLDRDRSRSAGSPSGSRRRRRGRATERSARRWSPTCSGATPDDVDGARPRWTPRASPGRVASGNYSSRFSGVGVGAVAGCRAEAPSEDRRDSRARRRRVPVAAARRGHRALESRRASRRGGARARSRCVLGAAEPRPARRRTTESPRRPRTASSSTSAPSRSTRETGEVRILDYVTVHDAGRLLNPLLADGQVLGGFAHGVGCRAVRAARLRRVREPDDRVPRGLPRPDCARHPGAADRASRRRRHP